MANTAKLKQSAVAGKVPTTSQLALGELAINTTDGKLYFKKNVSGTETIVDVTAAAAGLTPATATVLGGVKDGAGVTIATDGTLSADVTSVAGKTGAVTLAVADVSGAAPTASPTFTGTPVAPTAAQGTNTTQVATTAFVNAEIAADAAPIGHVGATGTAHGAATTAVAGFMSAADKTKLDGIAAGATANTGTVTAVTATAPVVSSGGTAPVISMAAATASVNGYMTSTYAAKLDGIAAGAQVNSVTSVFGRTGAVTLLASDVPTLNQNTTGSAGSCTGNSATATAATYLNSAASSTGAGNISGANRVNSGFYENSAPTIANGWPVDGGWYHLHATTHSNSGNYYSMQLAADFFSNSLYYRSTNGSGNTAWSKVLLSTNYTDYAPTKTGTGASGTWEINVTGSAGSVAWGNVSGRPTALSSFTNDSAFVTIENSVPAGAVAHFARSTAPSGWIKANGAAVSRTTYAALFAAIGTTFGAGDGSTTFNVPDLRGEFPRGWDDARGVDSGRVFGSAQSYAVQSHNHSIGGSIQLYGAPNLGSGVLTQISSSLTGSTGSTETRPRNIALLAVIKY